MSFSRVIVFGHLVVLSFRRCVILSFSRVLVFGHFAVLSFLSFCRRFAVFLLFCLFFFLVFLLFVWSFSPLVVWTFSRFGRLVVLTFLPVHHFRRFFILSLCCLGVLAAGCPVVFRVFLGHPHTPADGNFPAQHCTADSENETCTLVPQLLRLPTIRREERQIQQQLHDDVYLSPESSRPINVVVFVLADTGIIPPLPLDSSTARQNR